MLAQDYHNIKRLFKQIQELLCFLEVDIFFLVFFLIILSIKTSLV